MIEARTRHAKADCEKQFSSANKKSLVIYRELAAFWYGDVRRKGNPPKEICLSSPFLAADEFYNSIKKARNCHVDELLLFSSPESFFNCDNEEDFRTSLLPRNELVVVVRSTLFITFASDDDEIIVCVSASRGKIKSEKKRKFISTNNSLPPVACHGSMLCCFHPSIHLHGIMRRM
jgi:hypothetical protein